HEDGPAVVGFLEEAIVALEQAVHQHGACAVGEQAARRLFQPVVGGTGTRAWRPVVTISTSSSGGSASRNAIAALRMCVRPGAAARGTTRATPPSTSRKSRGGWGQISIFADR